MLAASNKYLRRADYTKMKKIWTRYVNGFLVHLPSGGFALDGNLVKSCNCFVEQPYLSN